MSSIVCPDPQRWAGQVIGQGECVEYIRECFGAPATSTWRPGAKARGYQGPLGVAIATFSSAGKYENVSGRSHAAVLVRVTDDGLEVWDQWRKQPVHRRFIQFKSSGSPVNDGEQFYLIEI